MSDTLPPRCPFAKYNCPHFAGDLHRRVDICELVQDLYRDVFPVDALHTIYNRLVGVAFEHTATTKCSPGEFSCTRCEKEFDIMEVVMDGVAMEPSADSSVNRIVAVTLMGEEMPQVCVYGYGDPLVYFPGTASHSTARHPPRNVSPERVLSPRAQEWCEIYMRRLAALAEDVPYTSEDD